MPNWRSNQTSSWSFIIDRSERPDLPEALQEFASRAAVDGFERPQSAMIENSRPRFSGVGCDRPSLVPA